MWWAAAGAVTGAGMDMKLSMKTVAAVGAAFATPTTAVNRRADAMVSVEGEALRGVTWVRIQEVEQGDWAIGGKTLTAADVHALAGRKAA